MTPMTPKTHPAGTRLLYWRGTTERDQSLRSCARITEWAPSGLYAYLSDDVQPWGYWFSVYEVNVLEVLP